MDVLHVIIALHYCWNKNVNCKWENIYTQLDTQLYISSSLLSYPWDNYRYKNKANKLISTTTLYSTDGRHDSLLHNLDGKALHYGNDHLIHTHYKRNGKMFSFIHRSAAIYKNHIPCHVFILFGTLPAEWIESERDLRELENSKSKGGKLLVESSCSIFFFFPTSSSNSWK